MYHQTKPNKTMKNILKTIAILAVTALVFTSCGKKGDEPTPATPVVTPPTALPHNTYTNVSDADVTTTIYIYSDGKAVYVDKNGADSTLVGILYIRTGATSFEEKTPSEIYNGTLSPIFTSKTGIKPTNMNETVTYTKQ